MAPNASDFETMKVLQSITSNDVDGKPLGFKAVSFSPATIDSADGADDSTQSSDFDFLKDTLNSAAQGPAASIKAGHVPQPPSVGIIPSGDDPQVEQLYKHLVEMQSMISLYTAIKDVDKRKLRGRTTPYNISIPAEAAIAAADSADSGFDALMHPLSGFLNITSQTTRTESFEMHRTSLHLDFLTKLFSGFSLNKTDLIQMDGVLTNFVQSISNIDISSQTESHVVDQAVWCKQVLRVNVSGDDSQPQFVHEPRMKLLYVHVDSESWKRAIGKSSDEGFAFNFHMDVVDAELNVDKYLGSRDKFDDLFQKLTGKNLEDFGNSITGTTVKTDANPAPAGGTAA